MNLPSPAPRRFTLGDLLAATAVAALITGVAAFGYAVFAEDAALGCASPWAACPGGPSELFPLGIELHVGSGAGTCNATSPGGASSCAYWFPLIVNVSGGEPSPLVASDLAFGLQNASGASIPATFLVEAASAGACPLGEWSSETDRWTAPVEGGACPASLSLKTPLTTGDLLGLVPLPSRELSYNGDGYELVIGGTSGGYSGTDLAGVGASNLTVN